MTVQSSNVEGLPGDFYPEHSPDWRNLYLWMFGQINWLKYLTAAGGHRHFTATYGTAYDEEEKESGMVSFFVFLSYFFIVITFPVSIWFCFAVNLINVIKSLDINKFSLSHSDCQGVWASRHLQAGETQVRGSQISPWKRKMIITLYIGAGELRDQDSWSPFPVLTLSGEKWKFKSSTKISFPKVCWLENWSIWRPSSGDFD